MTALRMIPHLAPRPWGGDRLGSLLGKKLPAGGPFGESWELSAHPDGESYVEVVGRRIPFGAAAHSMASELFGGPAPERYPLLVKYLDAASDLSVQVHPDDAWCRAAGHPDRGKTECWYVMACEPGAEVVYGFREGADAAAVREAIARGTLSQLLQRYPIRPGTMINVPAGTVHALGGGTLICEVQQSSNTTFRLFDWNRQPARELHIDRGLQVSQFGPAPPGNIRFWDRDSKEGGRVAVENEFFRVWIFDAGAGESIDLPESPRGGAVVNWVEGSGSLGSRSARMGDTFFIPAGAKAQAVGATAARLLYTVSLEFA